MALLAVLGNPHREAMACINPKAPSLAEKDLLRLAAFPQIRSKISGALARKKPVQIHISGARGEFVRFRVSSPKKYMSFAVVVLAPKQLRGMTPTEARKRLGVTGFRRLTLGVIGRMGPGKSELQSVLVPKSRVFEVAVKYLPKRAAVRVARNPISCPLCPVPISSIKALNAHLRKAHRNPAYTGSVSNRVRKNPSYPGASQNEMTMPFRPGKQYSVEKVDKWIRAHGTPAMQARWMAAYKQFKSFHKSADPKQIKFVVQQVGIAKGITDIDFVVSEGKEWMAPYQVPAYSGKHEHDGSQGRYVHAHGDSQIEVDIKKPAKLSKLPERFHTADGKFVGVIPSRNVKITDWYRG